MKGAGQILGPGRVHVQTDTGWRRRPRTLKHGRISMLVVGYMTHEIMRIFRCRRTVELKHGGISIQTSAEVVAYSGFCELSTDRNRRSWIKLYKIKHVTMRYRHCRSPQHKTS